jgi:hypothetical protein
LVMRLSKVKPELLAVLLNKARLNKHEQGRYRRFRSAFDGPFD